MSYIVMILSGLIAGNLVNIYTNRKILTGNIAEDYKGMFVKDASFYLIQFFMVSMYLFIYFKASDFNEILKFSLFSALMLAAAMEDFNSQQIPNKLIVGFIIIGVIINLFIHDTNTCIGILITVLSAAGIFGIIYKTSKGGIGAGDVKLIICSALFLEPGDLFTTIVIAFLFTFLTGIILMILRRLGKKTLVPFSPFILAGFLVSLF
ncbi:MAG TPA: A24 family peptidase [Pseudobacteroides sp.]|uniref:A24 family peptidase n=1 Tax=Pseudobacteroides sp. TaxID=1968840 RepID=UPI002F955A5E